MAEKKVAFLGLGAMGFGMASNLVKEGWEVTGYDVWKPTLERFVEVGGKRAETPREVVAGAPYVVFMVATAAQIVDALFGEENGAIHALASNAVIILSSTGPPEHTLNVRSLLDTKYRRPDVHLIDAPVSGGAGRAAAGTLTILASGADEALQRARPVLDAMADPKTLYVIPGGLGAGTNVKMVHQVLAGIHIVVAAEAMGFAAALGCNTSEAYEYLKASDGSSWMFENRGSHMIVDDPKIYSALNIIVKDMGIVTAAGRQQHFPLFLSSVTEQILATGVRAGYGLEDDCKLTKVYLPATPNLVLERARPSTPSPDTTTTAADTTTPHTKPKLELVQQLMQSVHVAAACEAMSLGKKVGLDTTTLYDIISTAAGSSRMFVERTPRILDGKWTTMRTVNEVISGLTEVIEEAQKIKYPLHLAGMTLQLFQQAGLRGCGNDPDVAVLKLWEGVDGAWFPRDIQ